MIQFRIIVEPRGVKDIEVNKRRDVLGGKIEPRRVKDGCKGRVDCMKWNCVCGTGIAIFKTQDRRVVFQAVKQWENACMQEWSADSISELRRFVTQPPPSPNLTYRFPPADSPWSMILPAYPKSTASQRYVFANSCNWKGNLYSGARGYSSENMAMLKGKWIKKDWVDTLYLKLLMIHSKPSKKAYFLPYWEWIRSKRLRWALTMFLEDPATKAPPWTWRITASRCIWGGGITWPFASNLEAVFSKW